MIRIILVIYFQLAICSTYAQHFGRDFFNNLTYESARNGYNAKLEKNIFNDLEFTDNKQNKITFNHKFLSKTTPSALSNSKDQEIFFDNQIKYYRNLSNKREEFAIDLFDSWTFETNENNYKAEFKKDIFNAQIFSDNKGNQISYQEKYLAKLSNHPFKNGKEQYFFFIDLIDRMSSKKNYSVDFAVDIFNKVIVSDNRGFKRESNDAYYLLPDFNSVDEPIDENVVQIIRKNNTQFVFENQTDFAQLSQSAAKKWTYNDSLGNRLLLSSSTWKKLLQIHGTEENVLRHLINEYLF